MEYYRVIRTDSEDELYHFGIKGMKWGVRRARRKEAKSAYKKATDKAFSKYEREINNIEKGYKRGQLLSEKDQAREAKVEADYQTATAKAKSKYKATKKAIRKDAFEDHKNTLKKGIEKSREKAEKRKKSYEKTTDWFGVGGAALRSYTEYQNKKILKSGAAHIINSAANAYISSGKGRYQVNRGVDFARRAAVRGLSFSTQLDQIKAFSNVGHAYMYQQKKRYG